MTRGARSAASNLLRRIVRGNPGDSISDSRNGGEGQTWLRARGRRICAGHCFNIRKQAPISTGIATRAGLISNICGGSRYWQGATRISICGRQDGCGAVLGPGDACGTCRANTCEGGRGAQGIAARRAHRINICEGGEAHMSVPLYQGQGGQYICAR